MVLKILWIMASAYLVAGCATPRPAPAEAEDPPTVENAALPARLTETPVSAGGWRPHLLTRCRSAEQVPTAVKNCLVIGGQMYRSGQGADTITELEICREENGEHGLLLITLGQLYLMAGQGEPDLLPTEGPLADLGTWERNKARLLAQSRALLSRARQMRPDDAAVDYLLADVARAGGDFVRADALAAVGRTKCTLPHSFDIMRLYQDLNLYPARLISDLAPEYPAAAVKQGISGEVELDLLIDPRGTVAQVETVSSPGASLTNATQRAARSARFEAAKIGKYPVWSWLRVSARFALTDPS